ncbi:MAG: deoxyribose-phosphate aldolase [Peptococcaceae bacterium]|nr:deoxyribose-phosphate aldolase [Peptococcaceae bacterium]
MDKAKLAGAMESTLLRPEVREEDVVRLCHEAVELGVAAVCVNPCWVRTAARLLHATRVVVVTVAGFPLGASLTQMKVQEVVAAKAMGAQEIDVVVNVGHVKSRLWGLVEAELGQLTETAHQCGMTLKIIVECPLLSEAEKRQTAQLAHKAGVDYLKTCTGFNGGHATVEDVKSLQAWSGPAMRIKASGGIAGAAQAEALLLAGARRLGTSRAGEILESMGEGAG